MKALTFVGLIILVLLGVTSCIDVGAPEAAPTLTVSGMPYDANSLGDVLGYVAQFGPQAINKTSSAPLYGLVDVYLDPNIFPCENGNDCYGLTNVNNAQNIITTIAMVTADEENNPTVDLRCTALTHELMHVLLFNLTGDADSAHTTAAVWAMSGMVNSAIGVLCPTNNIIPQCPEDYCQ